ncbi:hypothetical protein Q5752_001701 [Cryptotrichosporon argae]
MPVPYVPLSASPPSSPPSRVFSPGSPQRRSPTSDLRALELDSGAGPGRPRHARSSTVSSLGGFEFQHELLPLTPSGDVGREQGEEKHVGLLHGMALVVGMQVGSGIFSSPGVVVASVGSVGASLVVWVLSGVLAWTGASSFAELGCAIPLSGGAQAYLAYSFGPMASYLYTWAAVSTLKPGGSAIIALIFGEYVNRLLYHVLTGDPNSAAPEWSYKITAIVAILLVSALNVLSPTAGTHSAVILTSVKICSLIFVAVLGSVYLIRHGAGPAFSSDALFAGSAREPSAYAIALYSGLWAFDGWDQCSFVGGEMRDPARDLPRALHGSMLLVLALFLGANVAYFVVLAPATVASSNTVALDFGRATIGPLGAVVFSTLVSISCFGALNGGFYTTAKLIYAASRDHFLPSIFTKLHPRRRTPDNAMALQAALTIFFVVFGGGFRTLLNFFSVTSWTMYLTTVLGLLVLRVKEPHLERPYKTWLVTPITFCAVAMFLLLMPIFAAPWEALAAFTFMATGVPVYYLTAHSRRSRQAGKFGADDGDGPGSVWASCRFAWEAVVDDVRALIPARSGERIDPGASRAERRGASEAVEMRQRAT